MAEDGLSVRESAWAKVNLTFEVGVLRADGYHDVRSLMAAVDWCDSVRLRLGGRRGRAAVLKVRGRGAPTGASNLAVRAAAAWARCDRGLGPVSIELVKRVPAGAGLGGGSSDAAAVLRGLARLRPGRAAPADLAPSLGSDVAFFASGLSAACASGRGERLTAAPAPPPGWWLLVVRPAFGLSTAAVYRRLDQLRRGRPVPAPGEATARLERRLAAWAAGGGAAPGEQALMEVEPMLHNDLWPAALSLRPELGALRERVRREVGPCSAVAMTGSGSALYALLADGARAQWAARRLRPSGCVVRPLRWHPGAGGAG